MSRGQKIPLTIITGYLGAGKTTLLRNISKENKMKIAILMNEFGEIAIDSKVVKGKNIQMTELAGGCVCCSLSGEFEAAIAEIIEAVNPQWIVVETTGVAEPASLAYDVVENIESVKLDAIITVVDLDSMLRFPNLGHTGREQIELADMIILNKTDLIGQDDIEKIEENIKNINNRAHLIRAKNCEIDLNVVFGLDRQRAVVTHKSHKVEYDYFDYSTKETVNHKKFLEFLDRIPKTIYRSKGFVVTEKGSFLMNYVAGRYTIEQMESKITELVFIGKNIQLHKDQITKMLEKTKL
ncbi:MAG: CobW family GTP-binding protein [Candidatus Bilamarchaeum sp.]